MIILFFEMTLTCNLFIYPTPFQKVSLYILISQYLCYPAKGHVLLLLSDNGLFVQKFFLLILGTWGKRKTTYQCLSYLKFQDNFLIMENWQPLHCNGTCRLFIHVLDHKCISARCFQIISKLYRYLIM